MRAFLKIVVAACLLMPAQRATGQSPEISTLPEAQQLVIVNIVRSLSDDPVTADLAGRFFTETATEQHAYAAAALLGHAQTGIRYVGAFALAKMCSRIEVARVLYLRALIDGDSSAVQVLPLATLLCRERFASSNTFGEWLAGAVSGDSASAALSLSVLMVMPDTSLATRVALSAATRQLIALAKKHEEHGHVADWKWRFTFELLSLFGAQTQDAWPTLERLLAVPYHRGRLKGPVGWDLIRQSPSEWPIASRADIAMGAAAVLKSGGEKGKVILRSALALVSSRRAAASALTGDHASKSALMALAADTLALAGPAPKSGDERKLRLEAEATYAAVLDALSAFGPQASRIAPTLRVLSQRPSWWWASYSDKEGPAIEQALRFTLGRLESRE